MVWYGQSNRFFWLFWEKTLRIVRNQKASTFPLTFEGKTLFETLEERFGEDKKDFLKEMEEFVYETCRSLYESARENITPFPPTWKDLLNELPFYSTKYDSFIEEYSNAKSEVIDNYQWNLEGETKSNKKLRIETNNLSVLFLTFTKIVGYSIKDRYLLDLPPDFETDKKYDKLSTQVFQDFKKNVLKGQKVSQILHQKKRQEHLINQILGTTDLPRDWTKKLAKKADLDTLQNWKDNHSCSSSCSVPCHESSHSDYSLRHTESQEYQRIHTKLSGQVSDNELQALLDAIPNCSHSDYDTLKSEIQTLRTENTQLKEHKCDCDSKVAQKEREIIDKIITDLSLSTERERESLLEAVISEIKTKITPPQDITSLQTQLKNKETEIAELKKGNQSYLDLEKLVEQKQAENQALTTAKTELESQLNEKQKELLNQVLNQSSQVQEKTVKEEIIKVIEKSLTDQGINSQPFRKEIKAYSSLTEIEKLQGKYTHQKINDLASDKKSATYLNIGLGVLSIGSLLVLAYLLIKGTKKEMEESLRGKSD